MKTTAESAHPAPDELLAELRALIAEAEKILGPDAGAEPAAAESGLEGLRERLEAARDRLTDACDQVRRKVKTGVRHADDAIRENPYQAMAIAAGVGIVLGMLLNRRRD